MTRTDRALPDAEDAFQRFILREVLLAEGLMDDVKRAEWGEKFGLVLAKPAAEAIVSLAGGGLGRAASPVLKAVTKAAIIGATRSDNLLTALRHGRGLWQEITGDAESTAHSYCRSALAFAVQGKYDEAESWLQKAEGSVADLARPRFIRGMMEGAQGRVREASVLLSSSLQGRAKAVTKDRIREVLAEADFVLSGRD